MPKIEVCIISADGDKPKMLCNDSRLPPADQQYEKPITSNYIATNPDDFMAVLEACQRKKPQ